MWCPSNKYGKSLTKTTLTSQALTLYISNEKWAGVAELVFIYLAKYHTIPLTHLLRSSIRYLKVFHLYWILTKKKYLLTNIYRSTTPVPGLLPSEQLDEFNSHLDQLLTTFFNLSILSIILTDSNLNLLKLKENPATESYFNTVHSNGFLFVQNKATGQNIDNMALIDQIFTNHKLSNISSGVIIEDLSDHFPNFIQIPITMTKTKSKNLFSRSFNATNIINFHDNLNNIDWNGVYACNDVNLAFNIFWDKFITQFNISFPETKTKPNRNFYKINDYMTSGLLTSRRSKILLYKLSITDPSSHNIYKYKTYRNLYNSLVRSSKKCTL